MGGDQLVDGGDVFPGEAFSLVFAPEDVAQFDQIFAQRRIVVAPRVFVLELRLDSPMAAEFFRAHFAFPAFFRLRLPNVLVAHALRSPGGGFC